MIIENIDMPDIDSVHVDYHHDKREIRANGRKVSFEYVKQVIKEGKVPIDYNIAFERLFKYDGDMEEVEKYYKANP